MPESTSGADGRFNAQKFYNKTQRCLPQSRKVVLTADSINQSSMYNKTMVDDYNSKEIN